MIDRVAGVVRWREAMAAALYGPDGFFVRRGSGPAGHFRTSVHASPLFAGALLRLLESVDVALGSPDPLDLVDVGAGRGELLAAVHGAAPPAFADRLRLTAVELAPRPADLGTPPSPERPRRTKISWRTTLPEPVTGLVLATEWLDNVPVEVAEVDAGGVARYLDVDPATGEEVLSEPVTGPDADWLARWWPLTVPGTRAEIGLPRDEAWAGAVATVYCGAALAVDYGHLAGRRPPLGTLTGFRDGHDVSPVPDGSCDLTAHVAVDALADTGPGGAVLVTQVAALRALGVDGRRPPLELARRDPAAYLRGLASAGDAAELTDPAGLGGHHWLLQPVALEPDVARWLA